jgi:heme exporter protein A
VNSGEFLTIFGRNGAGKSTFLKITSSAICSYGGEVYFLGKNLKQSDEEVRRSIGFVSHDSFLYKDLTVHDNLMFYARMYGLADRKHTIDKMIETVGLEAKSAVLMRALSRGMKQRLAIARALLHSPKLLLLDEPFTGLDERASEVLDNFLAGFMKDGGTVIMATHNIERGWKHANRVAVLDRGSIVHEANVRDTTYDAFRSRYLEILAH